MVNKCQKIMVVLLLVLFGVLGFAKSSFATIYYVDYLNGLDTNNGLSTSAPFKHCPGDDNAANIAKATILTAGDRVIFKGGVQYTTSAAYGIRIKWSGSGDADANRIIYDGDSGTYATRWGSGSSKAIIDGGGVTMGGLFSFLGSYNYITINNFVLRNGHDVIPDADGMAGLIVGNGPFPGYLTYLTISNSDFSDAGHFVTNEMANGWGIYIGGNGPASNFKIYNNTFTDCYAGSINIGTTNNLQIYNNTITGLTLWPLTVATGGSLNISNISIHDNILKNIGKDWDITGLGSELLGSGGWTSTGWTGSWGGGWTHTAGNTNVLSNTLATTANKYYYMQFTVSGRTAGSFTIGFGGQSCGPYTASGGCELERTTTTANFTVTPTSDFNGAIILSVKTRVGQPYHSDYIYLYTTGAGGFVNLSVYNNKIYNNWAAPPYTDAGNSIGWGSGQIYFGPQDGGVGGGHWNGVYIYNNVLFNSGSGPMCITGTAKTNGKISNLYIVGNSCYGLGITTGIGPMIIATSGLPYTNVTIKNNIFRGNQYAIAISDPSLGLMDGTVSIDYNLYYGTDSHPFGKIDTSGSGSLYTWTEWKGFGYDSHSIGMTTDPKFFSTIPASFDLYLQAGSPAIDAGVSLGAPFNNDINGASRPQGSGWDIGAYEYTGTCTPSCVGKQCGDDGCGGSCGTCTGGYSCNASGQCIASDTTPPTITSVTTNSITSSGATITWSTNELSDSQVEYGLTSSYGSQTALNPSMTTSHSQSISGLSASTAYHYRVKSKDAAGNPATSGDYTFTTVPGGTGSGLLVHYDFENNFTQGMLLDSSGTGNNADCQPNFYVITDPVGVLNPANQCPTATVGPNGTQAAQFSGSVCLLESDYFFIPNTPSQQNLSAGTVSVWVNYNPLTDPNYLVPYTTFGTQRVLDTYLQGVNYSWSLQKNYGPQTQVTLNRGDHELNLLTFPDPGVSNSWNHYAFTWNDTTARAYYNGLLVQEVAKSDVPYLAFSDYIAMGALKHNIGRNIQTNNCVNYYSSALYYYRDHDYPGYGDPLSRSYVMPNAGFLNGKLDELRIYNRALTQSEIQQSMNSGGGTCIHESDTNCDGCVSDTELPAFIIRWYMNSSDVTLKELMEAIGLWKIGVC